MTQSKRSKQLENGIGCIKVKKQMAEEYTNEFWKSGKKYIHRKIKMPILDRIQLNRQFSAT